MKHIPRIAATALLVGGPLAMIATGWIWPILGVVGIIGGPLTMLAEYCESR
jgi:hypothetical protein